MPWYRAGSVAVTNGSAIVTGAGTDFVGNTQAGEVFLGPDGRVYEISAVQSATQLTIIPNYQGASAGGQAYGIQPTASFARDLALGAAQLLNTFGTVRDGIGQGLVAGGTLTAPGLRGAGDQDTGIHWPGSNILELVVGGARRLALSSTGALVTGRVTGAAGTPGAVGVAAPTLGTAPDTTSLFITNGDALYGLISGVFGNTGATWMQAQRVDGGQSAYDLVVQPSGGNLLVGATSGSSHRIEKLGLAEGQVVLSVAAGAGSAITAEFRRVNASPFNGGMPAALMLGHNTTNNRSGTVSGTLNASGADYAEYMLKAAGCGIIAKGDVCGVDRDGKLTKTWADAISFVVKSTDPSLVGGDTWAAHLPPKPEGPGAEPIEPAAPLPPAEDADEAALAAWRDAMAAYPALLASYQSEHTTWQQAMDAYAADLAAWEDELETARQCVDRIAFCGQVPCNVAGDFEVGDYIIAAANGAGIKAVAVKPDGITLAQYMRRIGKVWAIRDGRAWIDVQHG
ncbi:hypothetical protein [uncultured Sphingomonas sp.]|uniref:hypothetical protein n=1 Tax=uncultured Sphingomonas sp. TaxID=158754 RepID=UPI0025FD2D41|nr:hypothetical protein [uncultured Sphingomonas sp.]